MNNGIADIIWAKIRMDGYYDISLHGRCMEPLLQAGDKARVYPSGVICTGDIALLVLENGDVALHRIVQINENKIMTKGDFSGRVEIVGKSDIIGIAREFFLADRGWSKDLRDLNDILKLVELSLCIANKPRDEENERYRDMIWTANLTARQNMLNEIGGCRK